MEKQFANPIPVLMEDEPVHTVDRPYCTDYSCPCRSDYERNMELTTQPCRDGLMTYEELLQLYRGKNI